MPSSTGYQTWVIWEPVPQVAALKVGKLDVQCKPFAPKEKLGAGGSLMIVKHYAKGGVYDESISHPFPTFLVTWYVGVTQLVSECLSEQSDLCVAAYMGHLQEK